MTFLEPGAADDVSFCKLNALSGLLYPPLHLPPPTHIHAAAAAAAACAKLKVRQKSEAG